MRRRCRVTLRIAFAVAVLTPFAARHLAAEGWRRGLSASARQAVIWRYNRSGVYVDTVLAIALAIESPVPTHTTTRVPSPGTS